jgi:putative redox protein
VSPIVSFQLDAGRLPLPDLLNLRTLKDNFFNGRSNMQARVKWVEGLTFLGESASGHQILMDGNSGDKAPSPMEMVLMSAGGCSAIDVVSILQKGRYNVTDCEVKLTSERREEAPRLFTHINLHFIVTGKELKDNAVSRAVDLSAEKYCSVALMLEKAVNITHSYEVIEG